MMCLINFYGLKKNLERYIFQWHTVCSCRIECLTSCWEHNWRYSAPNQNEDGDTVKTNQHPGKWNFVFIEHSTATKARSQIRARYSFRSYIPFFWAGWCFSSALAYSCLTLLDLHWKQTCDRCQSRQVSILSSVSCLASHPSSFFAF